MMILYHRTTAANAEQILRDGFRDGVGTYMLTREHSGVWLSDVPLDIDEGAEGDTLLRVELPEQVIADFEWIEEGKPYREWLIPAQRINEQAKDSIVDEDEGREFDLDRFRDALDALNEGAKR
jgi:hypothetical protein